jgi:hypothetical protein
MGRNERLRAAIWINAMSALGLARPPGALLGKGRADLPAISPRADLQQACSKAFSNIFALASQEPDDAVA